MFCRAAFHAITTSSVDATSTSTASAKPPMPGLRRGASGAAGAAGERVAIGMAPA